MFMISFATRRRPWLYIVTFLMLTLSLIILDSVHALDPLKNRAAGVVASWQIRAQAIGDHISVARSSTQSTEDLQAELDAVKKQRDQLLADDSRLIGLERENAMLRNEIGFQQAHPTYDMVAAQVVKNDHETPERVITIDCQCSRARDWRSGYYRWSMATVKKVATTRYRESIGYCCRTTYHEWWTNEFGCVFNPDWSGLQCQIQYRC